MSRIESSLVLAESVEDVFAFLSKPESHRRFIPRCEEFTQTSAGDFTQAGTTVKGLLNYFGIRIPVDYRITEYDSTTHRLTMNGTLGPVRFTDGYMLASVSENTRLTFWLELTLTGWLKLFQPFARLIGKIHAWETLRNLKREVIKTSEV